MKYVLASLFILLLGIPSPGSTTPGEVAVGDQVREALMQGLTGDSALLSEFLGKPLIINVWASYCYPCLSEMGSLERLWQHYGDEFNVIGISIDDYPQRARGFLDRAGTTFPHYIDHQLELENMLGANTIPLTLLIDAQGRVQRKIRGAQEWYSPQMLRVIGEAYDIDMGD